MKLFSDSEAVGLKATEKVVEEKVGAMEEFEKDSYQLSKTVDAYVSVGTVYEHVAEESLTFVDKKNAVLFNEYIKNITSNLGLESVPVVSLESFEVGSVNVVNQEISLEGFLGKMWDKVKALFRKIYEAIKGFFVKHFTRVGSIKKKLNNLIKVLKETDKDIKQLDLSKVPGPVAKAFPYSGTVSFETVNKSLDTVKDVLEVLKVTNRDAIALASKEVLSKDFVATIKGLKNSIKDTENEIGKNEANKVTGVKKFVGQGRQTNKEIKETNKSLTELNKERQSSVDGKENAVKDIVSDKGNEAALDDPDYETAKREIAAYFEEITKVIKRLEGKNIPGGRTLTEAKVTEDGIELEFEDNKDTPDNVSLGTKTELLKLAEEMLGFVEALEKNTEGYGKVNDAIMKNIDTVDSLMKDLDKVTDNEDYKKYKALLEKKIRERLKMLQRFFTDYNKISKNLVDVVASTAEGVISYGVSSLKYFG